MVPVPVYNLNGAAGQIEEIFVDRSVQGTKTSKFHSEGLLGIRGQFGGKTGTVFQRSEVLRPYGMDAQFFCGPGYRKTYRSVMFLYK